MTYATLLYKLLKSFFITEPKLFIEEARLPDMASEVAFSDRQKEMVTYAPDQWFCLRGP